MGELALVRLHEDGEHLVLAAADGRQFALPITEELRAAVRRDRPHLEHLRAEGASSLPPREIQSRLRAGATVDSVAAESGMSTDQVLRYAGPVVAEQEFVIERARATRQGTGAEVPLDDLVVGRLTARAVDPASVAWSASRETGSPWTVTASFSITDRAVTARWTYDMSTRALHALDDEARWLSQTEADADPSPGRAAVFDVDASSGRTAGSRRPILPGPDAGGPDANGPDGSGASGLGPNGPDTGGPDAGDEETDLILDALSSRRGIRAALAEGRATAGDDRPFEDFDPPQTFDLDAVPTPDDEAGETVATVVALPRPHRNDRDSRSSHPSAFLLGRAGDGSARGDGTRADLDVTVPEALLPGDRPDRDRKGGRKGRAKVPSLDEIVFGAKPKD